MLALAKISARSWFPPATSRLVGVRFWGLGDAGAWLGSRLGLSLRFPPSLQSFLSP